MAKRWGEVKIQDRQVAQWFKNHQELEERQRSEYEAHISMLLPGEREMVIHGVGVSMWNTNQWTDRLRRPANARRHGRDVTIHDVW